MTKIKTLISNCPPRYGDIEYNELIAADDFAKLQKYGGLYFFGSVGTGKTARMFNLLAFLRNEKLQGSQIKDMITIFTDIKANSFANFENQMRSLKGVQILFIDDFGTENGTDHELQLLYDIVNTRWLEMYPTVFSSNISLEEWYKKKCG